MTRSSPVLRLSPPPKKSSGPLGALDFDDDRSFVGGADGCIHDEAKDDEVFFSPAKPRGRPDGAVGGA